MPATVHCDIVSAEKAIFNADIEMGVFPGEAGELGILPRHTPLLTRIKPGTIRLKLPEQEEFEVLYVSGGMLEVQPNSISVLADTAIRAKNVGDGEAVGATRGAAGGGGSRAGLVNANCNFAFLSHFNSAETFRLVFVEIKSCSNSVLLFFNNSEICLLSMGCCKINFGN